MSAVINTVAGQDVKRRGVRAIVERLEQGPVYVLQRNRPAFVALKQEQFRELMEEVEEARLRSSLRDVEAGRVRFASAQELIDEISE
ncbi:MAG: prevent-host-death protein [Acidobacteriota bacterium]